MRIHRYGLGMLLAAALCAAGLGAPGGAALAGSACSPGGCTAYLPLVAYTPQIRLLAPADGAQTSSLAPLLSWQAPFAGTFHIQVSEDAAFAATSSFPLSETKELALPLPAHVESLISTNLKPKTTYYWRVEKTTKKGEIFAALGHFITPQEPKLLPAAVLLLAPANKLALSDTTTLLQWQALPNTLYYRIRIYDANDNVFKDSTEVLGTQQVLYISGLLPGMAYHWKVKALNSYGWGPYAADFTFTVP